MGAFRVKLGFSKQLLLFTLILLGLPSFLTFYMLHVMRQAEYGLIRSDEAKLNRALILLDQRFDRTFAEILRDRKVPPDARKRDKVRVLNEELKPIIEAVAKEFPGVELGFYSRELDVILNGHTETYGENFSLRRKKDIERAISGQQPVVNVVGLERSGLIEAYRPLVRNGQVIGAVVAQEYTRDIYRRLARVRQEAYLTIAAGIIIGVGGFFFLLNRFLEVISRVKEGLANLEDDLSYRLPPAFGEWGEIAAAINHLADRLAEVRSFNEVILDNVDAGVVATDLTGRIVMVNPAAARVLGLAPGAGVGSYFGDIFPRGDPIRSVLEQALFNLETVRDFTLKYRPSLRSNSSSGAAGVGESKLAQVQPVGEAERDLILGTSLLNDQRGNLIGVVLTFKDVTERNRLEERAKRQERLAALGKFVAGVAHEIRNPLTSISGYIQMWQRYGQPTPGALAIVAQEIKRLNAIVDKLLFFTRPAETKLGVHDLNQLVDRVLRFVGEGYEGKIAVELELAPHLPPVRMDPEQIQQVLMNIIYNAYQAMPNGGTLWVRTGLAPDPQFAVVTITDTGCGIPPENLSRIFDPFFTTKARGSGLGLALAHEIVTAHGGYIEVESQVGVGTTLRVYLPVAKEGANNAANTRCG